MVGILTATHRHRFNRYRRIFALFVTLAWAAMWAGIFYAEGEKCLNMMSCLDHCEDDKDAVLDIVGASARYEQSCVADPNILDGDWYTYPKSGLENSKFNDCRDLAIDGKKSTPCVLTCRAPNEPFDFEPDNRLPCSTQDQNPIEVQILYCQDPSSRSTCDIYENFITQSLIIGALNLPVTAALKKLLTCYGSQWTWKESRRSRRGIGMAVFGLVYFAGIITMIVLYTERMDTEDFKSFLGQFFVGWIMGFVYSVSSEV